MGSKNNTRNKIIVVGGESMELQNNTSNKIRTPEIEFATPEAGVDFHWWHKNKTPLHSHTYYEIVIIVSENVTQICNDIQYRMEKYDVFILRPGDEHIFLAGKNSSHLNFSIVTEELSKICDLISPSLFAKINEHAPMKIKYTPLEFDYCLFLINQINLSKDGKNNESNNSLIKCIITNIMLAFNRYFEIQTDKKTAIPDWLVSFLDKLNSPEVFNQPLKQLYRLAPYSQTMLNIYFKQYVGLTLIAYIKKLKMEYAMQLLSHSNYTISQIAIKINYSTSHFTHEFTQETGTSPTKYREKLNRK